MRQAERHLLNGCLTVLQAVESLLGAYEQLNVVVLQTDAVLIVLIVGNGVLRQILARLSVDHDAAVERSQEGTILIVKDDVAVERTVTAVLRQLVGGGVIDEESLPQGDDPDGAVLRPDYFLDRRADVHAVLGALVEAARRVGIAMKEIEAEGTSEPDVVFVFE